VNLLGIDLWDKRCGIAYSIEGIVFPGETVPRVEIISAMKKWTREKKIEKIIIGLPYHADGTESPQLKKTRIFIEKLAWIFPDILMDTIDERYSTFEAISFLNSIGEKNIFPQKDTHSAVSILQNYLAKGE